MARCPLCESDVPDGRADCDACGQPFDQPPTVQAGAGEVQRAVAAAKKDISTAGQEPADVAFPQRLLERAEQEVTAGNLGRALDLARGARRATGIIRREARVAEALARAASEVDLARNEGVDIGEARKFLTQARDAVRRGVFGDIPLLAQQARNSLREARGVAAAEAALREVRREAGREKRKGADVRRAEVILDHAQAAMATKHSGTPKGLANAAHASVRHAPLL